ncbi:MAG: hypothetical protein N2560_01720 [Ignavibacteria bacterium]|nr:hypothetical protein [Ignavibacteria bacterium]
MEKFVIEGIEYEFEKFLDLNYTIQKMSEYLQKFGLQKSVRSQKFIRHLHIHIGLKIQKELELPKENVLFEVEMKNKNVDLVITYKDEPKILITIRSQTSSIKKNFTNNINSLQGEVVSLKNYYPKCKVGLVYLLKKKDIANNEDCSNYYLENIPKKLLPIVNTNNPTKDCFDAAMVIIWDLDDVNNVILDDSNIFVKIYNEENFIKDLKLILREQKIEPHFSLKDIDIEKFKKFFSAT